MIQADKWKEWRNY